MEKIFLAKVKNSDDRDCVKYMDFDGFECGHYFGGLHIEGACFGGFEKEFRDLVENNFDKLETVLTKDEFMKLFELNDKIKDLGYGIDKDSERYRQGVQIIKEYQNTIEKKLLSEENKQLFEKVKNDEKEYIKDEYSLSDDEINEIFDNYNLDYRDRAIVGTIFNNKDEMIEEAKWSFGYENQPYFDDEAFGDDLLNSESYLELDSGKIVEYAY